ncbi:MAG TPA: flagellin [Methanoculleus sp.]|nr:flagellin [Methanoculleus sp.]
MSSDTFTTAIFLIASVLAAAVLVNAFFPAIYSASSTFTKSSNSADERLRTDIKIINTFSGAGTREAKVWIKNIGSTHIPETSIGNANIFVGAPADFEMVAYTAGEPANHQWTFAIIEDTNRYWDEGETICIEVSSDKIPAGSTDVVYFQIVLPSGVLRTAEFTVS